MVYCAAGKQGTQQVVPWYRSRGSKTRVPGLKVEKRQVQGFQPFHTLPLGAWLVTRPLPCPVPPEMHVLGEPPPFAVAGKSQPFDLIGQGQLEAEGGMDGEQCHDGGAEVGMDGTLALLLLHCAAEVSLGGQEG